MLIESLKSEIINALQPINPERVILFGSYAWGTPHENSDIDLYVVTKDDFIPTSWREKRDIVRMVSKQIRSLRELYAIDLLVHTKPMYEKFLESGTSFSQDIKNSGEFLI
jgi:predicted nucleotidyltransferase